MTYPERDRVMTVILLCTMCLVSFTFISISLTIRVGKDLERVEKKLEHSVLVRDEMMIIAMNRANALWNGWMQSDSLLSMYLGPPPGKWIAQYNTDSLRIEMTNITNEIKKLRGRR